ncbi:hypothetical protein LJX78_07560 [Methanimicrococcus blatticola]|uniref:hypothetical protein n=1 Tax=Methanimicrococcus blatticola TaxID=91560 RepID=UPI001E65859F|nr:hypothetical protein [Methanimicrococcus blatticola]MCC2509444.1 hypothetical protein [Methanimicrococcus blatticola]
MNNPFLKSIYIYVPISALLRASALFYDSRSLARTWARLPSASVLRCYLPASVLRCYLPASVLRCYLPISVLRCYLPVSVLRCHLPVSIFAVTLVFSFCIL